MTEKGIELIKTYEKFRSEAYSKSGDKWTIGYGATFYPNSRKVQEGDTITESDANDLLLYMTENTFAPYVDNNVTSSINVYQRDALISFVYNVGPSRFLHSTLLTNINNNPNDRESISNAFLKYIKFKGKDNQGLKNRRNAEIDLYFSDTRSAKIITNRGYDPTAYTKYGVKSTGTAENSVKLPVTNCHLHQTNLYEITKGEAKMVSKSFFGSKYYYAQNNVDTQNRRDEETRKMAKCLLWLHTLPFNFKELTSKKTFFNSDNAKHGGIESFPYGYYILIGGLIWRKRYIEDNGYDPITMFNNLYRPVNKYDPLFVNYNNVFYLTFAEKNVNEDNSNTPYNVRYKDFVNPNMDYYTENALVRYFDDFVFNIWGRIEDCCEITFDEGDGVQKRINDVNWLSIVSKSSESYKANNYLSFIRLILGEDKYTFPGSDKPCTINGFKGNYSCIFPQSTNSLMMLYCDNNEISSHFNKLFTMRGFALTSGPNKKDANIRGSVSKTTAMAYLNGFTNTIRTLQADNKRNEVIITSSDDKSEKVDRDFEVEIYMYIKNLWDKWLCGFYHSNSNDVDKTYTRETFDVHNFFSKFVFIDSFYRNIFKKLKLNCEVLLNRFKLTTDSQNLYAYLGNIASDHQCMFLSLPFYLDLGDDDDTVAADTLKNVFRPIPASKLNNPQDHNYFVCIYTHEPSKIATSEKSDYNADYFDIWSESDGVNIAPDTYKRSVKGEGSDEPGDPDYAYGQINRYGYNVPAFGVAYSRQQNSIFKNVSATMQNPVMTEQAVKAIGQIADQGNSSAKKVTFYGQDIYPIYSNYSYIVEVEMMGNAQIQPLMYFQLLNIPMFRGTYMIISVSHNISQGNMVTKIKGVKMSKYAVPFTSQWFTITKNDNPTEEKKWRTNDSSEYGYGYTPGDIKVGQYTGGGYVPIYKSDSSIRIPDCKLAETVSKLIGTPYCWGNVDGGLDCSGFTSKVYNIAYGIKMPTGCRFQEAEAKKGHSRCNFNETKVTPCTYIPVNITKTNMVDFNKATIGDLMFMYENGKDESGHVMIYMGCYGGEHYVAHSSSSEVSGRTRYKNGNKLMARGVILCKASESALTTQTCRGLGHWEHPIDTNTCTGDIVDVKSIEDTNPNKTANDNIIYAVMSELINVNGFDKLHAAAICGYIGSKSNFNPTNSINGYGLYGWKSPRSTSNVTKYRSNASGIVDLGWTYDVNTAISQIRYLSYEWNTLRSVKNGAVTMSTSLATTFKPVLSNVLVPTDTNIAELITLYCQICTNDTYNSTMLSYAKKALQVYENNSVSDRSGKTISYTSDELISALTIMEPKHRKKMTVKETNDNFVVTEKLSDDGIIQVTITPSGYSAVVKKGSTVIDELVKTGRATQMNIIDFEYNWLNAKKHLRMRSVFKKIKDSGAEYQEPSDTTIIYPKQGIKFYLIYGTGKLYKSGKIWSITNS